jgi:hypothetical protein
MSPEDMQRMMQFLLNQQAQFAADFNRFDAALEKLSAKTDSIAEGVIGLTRIVGLIGGQVGDLAAAQQRTDEHLRELREQIRETDSHLSVVVDMFERHLREDHGHQRPS